MKKVRLTKLIAITLIGVLILGSFSLKRTNRTEERKSTSPILGMILLKKPHTLDVAKVVSELRDHWKLEVGDSLVSEDGSVLGINGYIISIAEIAAPIPGDEIQTTAEYNYFWENGAEEASKHESHVILYIHQTGKNSIAENLLFNKVAVAILNNSESLGFYMGERTLLLEKDFYIANSEMMSETDLPINNWIYFGLRTENNKRSIYTYGLTDFGKQEMEIVNSTNSFEELNEIMYDMTHYVIAYNVTLKDGETIGTSATQKLRITESQGVYVEGSTLKIDY